MEKTQEFTYRNILIEKRPESQFNLWLDIL